MSDLSETWKRRFALIEKAGGVHLTDFKTLSMGERYKARANWLAFLFGPIYYCCLGMWRKALTFVGLWIAFVVMAHLIGISDRYVELLGRTLMPFLFAVRANVDYYKRMVMQENGWW